MFRFLFARPISVIVIFVGFVALSALAIFKMPVSALPNIQFPEILIKINIPGASARDIDQTTIKELTFQLQQITEIKKLNIESADGTSTIRMMFNFGADLDKLFIEVNEKLELAMPSFPKDIERPRVLKSSTIDLPVFSIVVSLKDSNDRSENDNKFLELSEFAVQVVKRRLEQLPEVAFADLTGADSKIISIVAKTKAIEKYVLKSQDIKGILDANVLGYGNVSLSEGGNNYNVEVKDGDLTGFTSLENRQVTYKGRIFSFGELFDITVQPKVKAGLFLFNGKTALSFSVIKQPQVSLSELKKATTKVISEFSVEYPELSFDIIKDQTFVLDYAIKALKQDLIAGGVMAFFVLLIFFANFRRALLIFITIPVSLLLSLLFFHWAGITLNIISLAGLIVGVGLMIDNSIIVIDSISSHIGNCDINDACIRGVENIVRPLLASALTTCSVFVPLIFLSGIAGELFYDQAIAVCIALVTSVIVTTILLPILLRLMHSPLDSGNDNTIMESRFQFIYYLYKKGFIYVFAHKRISIATAFGLTFLGAIFLLYMHKERLPYLVEGEYEFLIKWNDDVSLGENTKRVCSLLSSLPKKNYVTSANVGTQQFLLDHDQALMKSEARLYVKARNELEAQTARKEILNYVENHYSGTGIVSRRPENIFEQVIGRDDYDLIIRVSDADGKAPSPGQMDLVRKMIDMQFHQLEIDHIPLSEVIAFEIDKEKVSHYNLQIESVYSVLKNAVDVQRVGTYGSGDNEIPVVIRLKPLANIYDLMENTWIPISNESSISISKVMKVSKSLDFQKIISEDNISYVPISINTSKAEQIKAYLNSNLKDPNIRITFSDKEIEQSAMLKEMFFVLLVAVLLLYLILAAQFDSLLQPLIVLVEIPISMFGALFMLWMFGATINLMSLIGFVVMSGIIINDSILKVDAINQLSRTSGLELIQIIEIAGKNRLKSIIMTAMVTVISVLPFLFGSDIASNLQRPLSLAIVGGMVIGTPVSLYLLPLIYWYCYKKNQNKI